MSGCSGPQRGAREARDELRPPPPLQLRALGVLRERRQRGAAAEDLAGHKGERDAVEDDVEAQAARGAAGAREGRIWRRAAALCNASVARRRLTHTNVCRLSM